MKSNVEAVNSHPDVVAVRLFAAFIAAILGLIVGTRFFDWSYAALAVFVATPTVAYCIVWRLTASPEERFLQSTLALPLASTFGMWILHASLAEWIREKHIPIPLLLVLAFLFGLAVRSVKRVFPEVRTRP